MAKGRGRAKQQPKPERKKETAHKRIGSDEVMQETFTRHLRAIEVKEAVVKEAQSELRELYEKAKEESVSKRSIKYALSLREDRKLSDERIEKARAERDEQMRVATWLGCAKQLDMFVEEPADAIWEDGKRAAMANEPASPPPHHSQKAAQRWMHGWHHGMKIVNVNRAEAMHAGFQPLGDTVAKLAEKAGVSASLGTAPPTHTESPEAPAQH
jgi:hypothetical protein